MVASEWLDVLGNIGDLVGGIATVAAVVLGLREVHRWREQRAEEKKSEAAARGLVALTRAHNAILGWAEALEDITDVEDPEMDFEALAERFQAADRNGRDAAEQALRDLHGATAEAYVHLENREAGFLANVQSMSAEMRAHVDSFITELECVPARSEIEVVRRIRATLREGRAFVQEQFQSGAAVLQPIARFKG